MLNQKNSVVRLKTPPHVKKQTHKRRVALGLIIVAVTTFGALAVLKTPQTGKVSALATKILNSSYDSLPFYFYCLRSHLNSLGWLLV